MLGGVCVKCGATDDLQFDHVDPSQKIAEITNIFRMRPERWLDELMKCQLLCAPCHVEKTAREQGVEHGEGLSGKKNCPCGPCRARKAEYNRLTRKPARGPARRSPLTGEHGGGTQGIRSCKCSVCRAKRAEYQRILREKQKGLM